ncbi:unnamed protein product [marine sediment metagenome]|uniref:Uncharacterized protein n=1 Tax=marine sediment metagenome TaxID=412755 RepID=X0UC88_9ZZZZ
MKLFPKIKFVNLLPLTDLELVLKNNEVLLGYFRSESCEIFVLRTKRQIRTLLHELGHWIIYVVSKKNRDKRDYWWDSRSKTIIKFKSEKWVLHQIETRKERIKNVKCIQ